MKEYRITDFIPLTPASPATPPAPAPLPELLWSPKEVARALGVPRYRARALMTAGAFGNPHILSATLLHAPAARVRAYVAQQSEVRA